MNDRDLEIVLWVAFCILLAYLTYELFYQFMPRDWLDIPDGCGNVGEEE